MTMVQTVEGMESTQNSIKQVTGLKAMDSMSLNHRLNLRVLDDCVHKLRKFF